MRVLVVDDSVRMGRLLKRALTFNNMSVDVAEDGERALAALAQNTYAVAVVDRELPGLSGDDVCSYINDQSPGTKVLLMSKHGMVGDRVSGLGAGADDFVVKPFAIDELVARIRALARRSGDGAPTTLSGAGIELDTVAMSVVRAGTAIRLTRKEFEVLELFMSSPRSTFSMTDLMEGAWDADASQSSKSLRVIIGRLRKKLGPPSPIETVVNFGYRFNPDAIPTDDGSPVRTLAPEVRRSTDVLARARDNFIAEVVDTLVEPITLQLVVLDVIEQEFGGDPGLAELLVQVKESIREERYLINRMVLAGRLMNEKQYFKTVDLVLVLNEILTSLNRVVGARELRMELTIDDEVFVKGDVSMLRAVVGDLLRKAIRNSQHGGIVEVNLHRRLTKATFSVRNGGKVVRPDLITEELRRCNEPLEFPTPAPVNRGLCFTNKMVRYHDGRFAVSPNKEGGMLVEVELPLA